MAAGALGFISGLGYAVQNAARNFDFVALGICVLEQCQRAFSWIRSIDHGCLKVDHYRRTTVGGL
jgi:hypothetical protein